jgi:hypothetical protein
MAAEVTAAVALSATDYLYRGINPLFYEAGTLLTGLFTMKKKHTLEEGPSVGIEKLIPLKNFQSFIKPTWGVGKFQVNLPIDLGLRVCPTPAPKWQGYETAHAVITDYQNLSNSQIGEIERALRIAVQQNILVHPQK